MQCLRLLLEAGADPTFDDSLFEQAFVANTLVSKFGTLSALFTLSPLLISLLVNILDRVAGHLDRVPSIRSCNMV